MSWKFDKALIQRMIDRMNSGPHRGALTACITEIDSLESKVEEMQKTLEWYADEKNHEVDVTSQWEPVLPIDQDKGGRARDTLKHLGLTVEGIE